MATYTVYNAGTNVFDAYNSTGSTVALSTRLLYTNASEFGITNADGSKTFVKGTGFVWNQTTKQFTAGTITAISHFTAGGLYVDGLTNLGGVTASDFQSQLEQTTIYSPNPLRDYLLQGADLFDGRYHGGDGSVAVVFDARGGDDVMRGSKNHDKLYGNTGNDRIFGNAGADHLFGGEGDDYLAGGVGRDHLFGDTGKDRLIGGGDADLLTGGSGNDYLAGGLGVDTAIFRGRFSDYKIVEYNGILRVSGIDGLDRLLEVERLAFDDGVYAWSDQSCTWEKILNAAGQKLSQTGEVFNGTNSGDVLGGTAADDVIYGLGGDDNIYGNGGSDLIFAGGGNDTVSIDGSLSTSAAASASVARIYGEDGNDTLTGGKGNDVIYGGKGDDIINGGSAGNDTLYGGGGADQFVFVINRHFWSSNWNHDRIMDFQVGKDSLSFTGVNVNLLAYANNADGNAVITFSANDTITLIGVDANVTAFTDLLA